MFVCQVPQFPWSWLAHLLGFYHVQEINICALFSLFLDFGLLP